MGGSCSFSSKGILAETADKQSSKANNSVVACDAECPYAEASKVKQIVNFGVEAIVHFAISQATSKSSTIQPVLNTIIGDTVSYNTSQVTGNNSAEKQAIIFVCVHALCL